MRKSPDVCETFCYDEEKVERLKPVANDPGVSRAAALFKALADETRAKIAYALCQETELCVCDVAHVTGSTLANASHHLRLLKSLGLAKFRKEGKLAFYSLEDDHVRQLMLLAVAHAKEGAGHAAGV
ncbi:ArsR/SmtB family transcription factor [Cohnella caldifontis]|uniref:ArsR/SmtB family transcription factor n=1 Tax=Cohnella caldifontis TaxID=3027471 RepID=UPI0023EB96B0|nr:metalloregulator ArsR/SmtB family transcription factor [Cohnella sp. YIM B05605]